MNYSSSERFEKRAEFINDWYKIEKMAERIAGVILFFVAAIIAVFDQPSDQWTLLAMVASVAGSFTFLLNSRRPRAVRTSLRFSKADVQTRRAMFAGIGVIMLISQLGTRPLALILSAVLTVISLWYQWRARKIQAFDTLFKPADASDNLEADAEV